MPYGIEQKPVRSYRSPAGRIFASSSLRQKYFPPPRRTVQSRPSLPSRADRQSTLTQIDFITRSPDDTDSDENLLEQEETSPRAKSARTPRSLLPSNPTTPADQAPTISPPTKPTESSRTKRKIAAKDPEAGSLSKRQRTNRDTVVSIFAEDDEPTADETHGTASTTLQDEGLLATLLTTAAPRVSPPRTKTKPDFGLRTPEHRKRTRIPSSQSPEDSPSPESCSPKRTSFEHNALATPSTVQKMSRRPLAVVSPNVAARSSLVEAGTQVKSGTQFRAGTPVKAGTQFKAGTQVKAEPMSPELARRALAQTEAPASGSIPSEEDEDLDACPLPAFHSPRSSQSNVPWHAPSSQPFASSHQLAGPRAYTQTRSSQFQVYNNTIADSQSEGGDDEDGDEDNEGVVARETEKKAGQTEPEDATQENHESDTETQSQSLPASKPKALSQLKQPQRATHSDTIPSDATTQASTAHLPRIPVDLSSSPPPISAIDKLSNSSANVATISFSQASTVDDTLSTPRRRTQIVEDSKDFKNACLQPSQVVIPSSSPPQLRSRVLRSVGDGDVRAS